MSSQNVLIVGTGAIGAFFASRLATLPSIRVSTICRSNYRAVLDNGIRITSPLFGDTTFRPRHVFASPDEAKTVRERWDWIFVSTKVTGDSTRLLEGLINDDGQESIVVCQNGLGIEAPYARKFPKSTIISAVTRTSVHSESPSHIKHNHWTRTTIGPFVESDDHATAQKRVEEFAVLLKEAGMPDVFVLDHIGMQFARWHKTAINAAVNPTAVLAGGVTNQGVGIDDELCLHAKGVMKEVLDAAEKVLGQKLPTDLPTIEDIWDGVRKDTSGSKASMLVDWEAGRQVELEAILGEPLRQARAKGLEMPRTQSLYALLKSAQAMRERARASTDRRV